MHKFSFFCLGCALVSAYAWAAESLPVVHMQREAVEGMVWETGPVTLGKMNMTGSLQGLGSPRSTGIGYELKGQWEQLEAYIGYVPKVSAKRSCRFVVVADGKELYRSNEIHGGEEPERIRLDVTGKNILVLSIEQVSYGGTLGACYGQPMLKRGLTAEEKAVPYRLEVNGRSLPYDQFSAPTSVPVELPVKPGETTYQVKVVHDVNGRRVQVVTTPSP